MTDNADNSSHRIFNQDLFHLCVSKGKLTIAIRESHDEQYSHAEKLAVFVDEVIKEVGGPGKLDAVCVSKGTWLIYRPENWCFCC